MIKQVSLWVVLFPLVLLTKVLATVLAPLIAVFITTSPRTDRVKRMGNTQVTLEREYLIKPLYWFQTHDNAVDEYWWGMFNTSSVLPYLRNATQEQYNSSWFLRYLCRVMWMWRNAAYGFSYNVFSRPLDETLSEKDVGVEREGLWYRFTQRRSSWQLKALIPTPWFWFISINIGWKPHDDFPKCMYAGKIIGTDS